jgi:hypothetical protein
MILMIVLAWLIASAPSDAAAAEGRTYRLAMARISESRGQNLEIKLAPVDGKGAEVTVRFPAHSLTPHERELRDAVRAAVRHPGHGWTAARGRVTFSLPAEQPSMSQKWWDGVRIVQDPNAEK